MAKGNGRGTTAGHNSASLHAAMAEKFERIYELDHQIEQARETHVKPLQEQKNEVKKELRDALDAKEADLKPWYQLFKRKRDCERFEEDDDGRKSLDMLRLGFNALKTGGQLDYITILDSEADADRAGAAE